MANKRGKTLILETTTEHDSIKSKDIKIIPINEIKENPKNRNLHDEHQIKRLVKLIKEHGFRVPLIISNRSGLLVAGHGRLLAAKEIGLTHLPVIYQDFETEEEEYQFGVADNAIASWAEIDLSNIHIDLPELGPFDIELLGLRDFQFEPIGDNPIESNIDPELEFSKEIDDKHDYIVFLFKKRDEMDRVLEAFDVKRVNVQISASGNESFVTQGLGRIVDGRKLLAKL